MDGGNLAPPMLSGILSFLGYKVDACSLRLLSGKRPRAKWYYWVGVKVKELELSYNNMENLFFM